MNIDTFVHCGVALCPIKTPAVTLAAFTSFCVWLAVSVWCLYPSNPWLCSLCGDWAELHVLLTHFSGIVFPNRVPIERLCKKTSSLLSSLNCVSFGAACAVRFPGPASRCQCLGSAGRKSRRPPQPRLQIHCHHRRHLLKLWCHPVTSVQAWMQVRAAQRLVHKLPPLSGAPVQPAMAPDCRLLLQGAVRRLKPSLLPMAPLQARRMVQPLAHPPHRR